MARTVSPQTAERHQAIVQMRTNFPLMTNAEIGERLGVSSSTVNSVCSAAGAVSDGYRRRRASDADRARRSDFCVALGAVMADYQRQSRASYDAVAMNTNLVNRMVTGLHSFTMLELERIAAWMTIPVSEMMRLAEQRLISLGTIGRSANGSSPHPATSG